MNLNNWFLIPVTFVPFTILLSILFIYSGRMRLGESYTSERNKFEKWFGYFESKSPSTRKKIAQFHCMVISLFAIIAFLTAINALGNFKFLNLNNAKTAQPIIFYSLFLALPLALSIAKIVRLNVVISGNASYSWKDKKYSNLEKLLVNIAFIVPWVFWVVSLFIWPTILDSINYNINLQSWHYVDMIIISVIFGTLLFIANTKELKNFLTVENGKQNFYIITSVISIVLIFGFILMNNVADLANDNGYVKFVGPLTNINIVSFGLLALIVAHTFKVLNDKNLYIMCLVVLAIFGYDLYLTRHFDSPYYLFSAITITSFIALGLTENPISKKNNT